ncbi:hypothetical protein [Arenicella xantha]|uniref:Uncharacterized protein n=1 Tax=Arenicella xantha TaxID=644221 RepID=A0A395JL15_9GAMM|nr:hypothetical protein [Arenicella xantha]RBP51486.1 hypothetical protein DFR28_102916 [Arenicella xantha]
MKKNAESRIQFADSMQVLKFYLQLLAKRPMATLFLVFLGFLVRGLSVVVFVLIVKVFLSVIDPSSIVKVVNQFASGYGLAEINQSNLLYALVIILVVLIVAQYVLNKVYLFFFLHYRTATISGLLLSPLNDHVPMHLHICLDKVPIGYEGVIKSLEILLFYFFLFSGIFLINPLAGLLVLLLVPIMLALMLLKGRKEVFVHTEMQQCRKAVLSMDDDYLRALQLINENYMFGRNSIIYSELFGGISIVIMMIAFMLWYSERQFGFSGVAALFLVFGIRFAVVYAGELSRVLSRVLQQRIIVEKIQHPPI